MDWQQRAVALHKLDISWRKIADLVSKPKSTVSDFLRHYTTVIDSPSDLDIDPMTHPRFIKVDAHGYISAKDLIGADITTDKLEVIGIRAQEHINQRILFISDLHIPYHHPKVFEFLEGLKIRYNPTRVVLLGDELDKHALSFHDSDPDLPSAGDELRKALPYIRRLKELFPVADILESNHGSLLYRKGKHHGIPRHYLKSYNEILEVDDRWKWHFDLTLELPDGQKVYVHHGKNVSAIKVAQTMGMSHVSGHYHESFGIQYYSTPTQLLFGMNAGCLIDRKSLAFAYNNNNLKRPIIGTGLIIDGVPILEAMPL